MARQKKPVMLIPGPAAMCEWYYAVASILEEVKKSAAERWVNAVNADAGFGVWTYAVAKKVSDASALISSATH